MFKKYIIGALASLVLLILLFSFSHRDISGKFAYVFPDKASVFNIVENDIPSYFCYGENKLYGVFKFKIIEKTFLPDYVYIGLVVYNKSSGGEMNYTNYKLVKITEFMSNTTPPMEPTKPYVLGTPIPGIAGGILYVGTERTVGIYNSTDPNVFEKTYNVDIGMYNLNLPSPGTYFYIINITGEKDGAADIEGENYGVLSGELNIIRRNCTLGLNNVNLDVVDGGDFYSGDSVNCSAKVDGRFFEDLSKSTDKINFNLEWYNGSKFFNYKSVNENSGISCNLDNSCSAIFAVSESHLNKWRCIVNVSNGVKEIIKSSNNLTMLNSPPQIIKNIPNLTFSGGFKEDFIKLSDYFIDPDGDSLNYSYSGGSKINLSINNDGSVNITAPYDYNLSENFYFFAEDSLGNKIQSKLVNIKIVESSLTSSSSNTNCVSNWSYGDWNDCMGEGIRTRTVIDSNNCGIDLNRPAENESCTYMPGEPLATESPQTQGIGGLPQVKKKSLFENKFLLSGLVLGLFLLLILILLLIDRLRKRKQDLGENKEKPEEYKPKFENKIPLKQVKEETSLINVEELNRYVKDMLTKGGSIESIKEKLISSGWNKEQVENAINFVRVKQFVDSMLNKGESREKIRELLKTKGWKDDLINKVLK